MSYLFGPVASRRMGLSLGLDIIPRFTCTYSCVYCEVGHMKHQTLRRRVYAPVADVLAEIRQALVQFPDLDYITFSGSGEPTLHASIGQMIYEIKQMTTVPVAVITNGSLLFQPQVRQDLLEADLIMPSLDAVTQEVFERVNQATMKVSRVIQGLREFRQEYQGQLWLEILFVQGINDTDAEIENLAEVLPTLGADRVQLNTVIRPPAESLAEPVTRQRLEEIQRRFGPSAEIIALFGGSRISERVEEPEEELLTLLDRRGCTFDEITHGLGIAPEPLRDMLQHLTGQGVLEQIQHAGATYYRRTQE